MPPVPLEAREITLRLRVRRPLPGVRLAVQRGRDALLPPRVHTDDVAEFDLQLRVVGGRDGILTLRGAEVQGPPSGRFVYVNVGTSAGQAASPWTRRAKVPLSGITPARLAAVCETPGTILEAEIAGTGRDGSPACATVPLLGDGWCIANSR